MSRMPVVFIGHGSPMNAIEDNVFTRKWIETAAAIPRAKAILSVSAHWTTHGSRVSDSLQPQTVYDMFGFPQELYELKYQPPGSPALAQQVQMLLPNTQIDNRWGIDHGTWSVLNWLYPRADIPVVQLSLNLEATRQSHFEMGQALSALRDDGVLILGSGNVVHNLALINWRMNGGYPWAESFDWYIQDKVSARNFAAVVDYRQAGSSADSAFFTTEHFDPLLYVLGASDPDDQLTVFNNVCLMGSMSMTCYLFS